MDVATRRHAQGVIAPMRIRIDRRYDRPPAPSSATAATPLEEVASADVEETAPVRVVRTTTIGAPVPSTATPPVQSRSAPAVRMSHGQPQPAKANSHPSQRVFKKWVTPTQSGRSQMVVACFCGLLAWVVFPRIVDWRSQEPGYMEMDLTGANGTLFDFIETWTAPVALVGLLCCLLIFLVEKGRARASTQSRSDKATASGLYVLFTGALAGSPSFVSLPTYNLFYLTARSEGSVDFELLDVLLLIVQIPLFIVGYIGFWALVIRVALRVLGIIRLAGEVTE